MTVLSTICARGDSVGVPGKNKKLLQGKPLISHTIEQALRTPEIDVVIVSTDDNEIAAIAKACGAEVPFIRPKHLATNEASKLDVIEHAVLHMEATGMVVTKIVDLDPTSPLRSIQDIQACIAMLGSNTDVVITTCEAQKNPYFNMVEYIDEEHVNLVKPMEQRVVARQMAPKVYEMNASIYVWHRHTFSNGLWSGNTKNHIMPVERSIDIDSPIDFTLVELLMQEKQNV